MIENNLCITHDQFLKYDLSIIPLKTKSKIPSISWLKYQKEKATGSDIEEWFANSNKNIGVVLGDISNGVICLDFDDVNIFEKFQKQYPEIVRNTPISSTGKGYHVWIKTKEKVGSFPAMFNGEHMGDVKGNGGYVVAPPSIHENGKLYEWINGLDIGFHTIDSLEDIGITPKSKAKQKRQTQPNYQNNKHFKAYIDKLLNENCRKIEESIEGERNNNLFKYACNCFNYVPQYIDFNTVYDRCLEAALITDLPEKEIKESLVSASTKGMKTPKEIPCIFKNKGAHEIDTIKRNVKKYQLNDKGNCDRFMDLYGKDFIYTDEVGFFYWNGKQWLSRGGDAVIRKKIKMIPDIIFEESRQIENKELQKKVYEWSRKTASRRSRDFIFNDVQDESWGDILKFDENDFIINLENGVLNLKTGELMQHDQNFLCTRIMNISYNKDAKAPLWEKFLLTIFDHDEELIQYIQKLLGHLLTGSTEEHIIHFLFGDGENGKTTLLVTLEKIFKDYFERIPIEALMHNKNMAGPNPNIVKLKGARFVVGSESNANQHFNESLLKDLRGGDSITARNLNKPPITFFPKFKMFLYGNHKPSISSQDHGIKRSLRIIPFNHRITPDEKIKNFHEKMLEESSGILNWMIEGLKLWKNETLSKMPKAMQDSTKEYFEDNNYLKNFLDEVIEETTERNTMVSLNDLYAVYLQWTYENGEYQYSKSKLSKLLLNQGLIKLKTSKGWHWENMKLANTHYKSNVRQTNSARTSEVDRMLNKEKEEIRAKNLADCIKK